MIYYSLITTKLDKNVDGWGVSETHHNIGTLIMMGFGIHASTHPRPSPVRHFIVGCAEERGAPIAFAAIAIDALRKLSASYGLTHLNVITARRHAWQFQYPCATSHLPRSANSDCRRIACVDTEECLCPDRWAIESLRLVCKTCLLGIGEVVFLFHFRALF